MRLVDGTRRPPVRVQAPPVTRAPAPVDAVDRIDHHDVAVQMRVQVAVDPVGERRTGEPRRLDHRTLPAPRRPHGAQPVALEIPHRPVHRLRMRPHHLARRLLAAQRKHDARRFRRAERQVVRRHRDAVSVSRLSHSQRPVRQQRAEPCRIHRRRRRPHVQPVDRRADPPSGGVPTVQRHLRRKIGEVVVSPPGADPTYPQHPTPHRPHPSEGERSPVGVSCCGAAPRSGSPGRRRPARTARSRAAAPPALRTGGRARRP